MATTITKLTDSAGNDAVVTAGDDFSVTITLHKNGSAYNISSGAATVSIRALHGVQDLIEDKSLTLTTPASGIVTLSLSSSETDLFTVPDRERPDRTVTHIADIKSVVDSSPLHHGPFSFEVRGAIT